MAGKKRIFQRRLVYTKEETPVFSPRKGVEENEEVEENGENRGKDRGFFVGFDE